MQTAHQLFLHGLNDILDGERQLLKALKKNADEATHPELKQAFESHRSETQKQIRRLEEAFHHIGVKSQVAECRGIKGLIQEHQAFIEEETPSPELADMEAILSASKIEAYEITEYESLLHMAEQLGHPKVTELLHETLDEERQALKKMQVFSNKMRLAAVGLEPLHQGDGSRRIA